MSKEKPPAVTGGQTAGEDVEVRVQRADDRTRHRGIGYTDRPMGCPMGCPLGEHVAPCQVGKPVGALVDYGLSSVGIDGPSGPRVVSLRRYRRAA